MSMALGMVLAVPCPVLPSPLYPDPTTHDVDGRGWGGRSVPYPDPMLQVGHGRGLL